MYVKFKMFYNYFNRVSFYSIWGKKRAAKKRPFLEIFQILPLRAVAPIFFFVWPIDVRLTCHVYWRNMRRKVKNPDIWTLIGLSMHGNSTLREQVVLHLSTSFWRFPLFKLSNKMHFSRLIFDNNT